MIAVRKAYHSQNAGWSSSHGSTTHKYLYLVYGIELHGRI